ncbi:hypothetical protein HHL28_12385 [Aerophototrophica crusticola]|uniref:Peptidase S10 n=1 Tax=Aerophototrophica crusticola TaxID=1709002 RepID=A0A858R8L4_9PROT|nr:hypothetical protein HHL28_12385 [Rhodospirillaceae bacterium B3]
MAETETRTPDPASKPEPVPPPRLFETQHTGVFNGTEVDYRAVAGEQHLLDEKGKPRAAIFSVAYLMDGVDDPARRPVTFLFNGGPGSASLWLHMGNMGPKRVAVPSDATSAGAPPYAVVDNPLCPWTSPTWSSSTRWAPATAAPWARGRRRISGAWTRTASPWPSSSGTG